MDVDSYRVDQVMVSRLDSTDSAPAMAADTPGVRPR
jgi:hypothetical protein